MVGAVINRTLMVVLNISVEVDVIDGNVVVELVLSMVVGTVIVWATFVVAIVVVAII